MHAKPEDEGGRSTARTTKYSSSGGSRMSQRECANCKGGGANLFLLPIFPKNCMKLKKFGPRGGARRWHPLGTANEQPSVNMVSCLSIGRSKGSTGIHAPLHQKFFIFMHFYGRVAKLLVGAPLGWHLPLWEILSPPKLSNLCHTRCHLML